MHLNPALTTSERRTQPFPLSHSGDVEKATIEARDPEPSRAAWPVEGRVVTVAVLHDSSIFRRGLALTLDDDPILRVVEIGEPLPQGDQSSHVVWDVAVCTETTIPTNIGETPIVLLPVGSRPNASLASLPNVSAVLRWSELTPDRLIDTVRVVASGLRVRQEQHQIDLSQRQLKVLSGLSHGEATRQISETLGLSERTVKQVIFDTQRTLDAQNRCQAVANALRRGLI